MTIELYNEILLRGIKKIVFLGGSGSGKSELAVNFALEISKLTDLEVHLFDMDQTKPLFRSRELEGLFEGENIKMHSGEGLLDSPIVPAGVENILRRPEVVSIFDVGGNDMGAFTMGQYNEHFNTEDTQAFFVYNYYRPFSDKRSDVEKIMSTILNASRISNVNIIGNPNLGITTSETEFVHGVEKTKTLIDNLGYELSAYAIHEQLYSDAMKNEFGAIIPMKLYINDLMSY